MSATIQPKLKFVKVDIPLVNFLSHKFYRNEEKIDINIDTRVFYPKDRPNHFNILMDVTIKCDGYFDLNISAIGNYILGENLEEGLKKNLVNVNAPAIMFPYLRSFITTFTSNIGDVTGSLVIPPHFFNGELPEHKVD